MFQTFSVVFSAMATELALPLVIRTQVPRRASPTLRAPEMFQEVPRHSVCFRVKSKLRMEVGTGIPGPEVQAIGAASHKKVTV